MSYLKEAAFEMSDHGTVDWEDSRATSDLGIIGPCDLACSFDLVAQSHTNVVQQSEEIIFITHFCGYGYIMGLHIGRIAGQ